MTTQPIETGGILPAVTVFEKSGKLTGNIAYRMKYLRRGLDGKFRQFQGDGHYIFPDRILVWDVSMPEFLYMDCNDNMVTESVLGKFIINKFTDIYYRFASAHITSPDKPPLPETPEILNILFEKVDFRDLNLKSEEILQDLISASGISFSWFDLNPDSYQAVIGSLGTNFYARRTKKDLYKTGPVNLRYPPFNLLLNQKKRNDLIDSEFVPLEDLDILPVLLATDGILPPPEIPKKSVLFDRIGFLKKKSQDNNRALVNIQQPPETLLGENVEGLYIVIGGQKS
ncbi:hypothetical protein A3D05_03665 [Candidatus Gottesmanbacteria bacterium RIFCSPHIGHO2_02_FULL_40_24]|uniref:Uncharacterized protein n=1 Tax=Candidatus Gottesmanbacteria bacterium RIFCSPHIGHO2_01_FULL_40_15 TaxID=1798376 RepID=A0A1F5Z1N1_9BACT|nr:MAG: hypothetical protein A2777_06550 [Candidatus Gottesmanbacteria bacterium RIFCSPHIGHO2_01_FULL_40_15]OGG16977.1 MAG: hypothetical protein A3D05_03665 [Candidatus Gottesmanbacteria bacterium RIFCSPHIGHO2_02_FULL_40_24]OGG31768.1 MAG: hypothetical protein A3I80_04400 [Candidatus Gottesmanbacteria bacterium RIFCSPLOWO2_02_FULL_40_10]